MCTKFKKILSGVTIIAMAITLLAPGFSSPDFSYGAGFSDTSGHWAERYINSAINKGIVKGYADGKFRPDNPVSRAEFASMVNKALGNADTASINFTDVPSNEWYYNDISKAVAATYVSGYDDSSFKPNSPISREEAAVIISRIVPTSGVSGNIRAFSDYTSVSDWANTALAKANGKGYIGAYDDGKIHPKDQLTRAQTAKIICDITDKESIVSSAPVVKTNDTKLSGKIYSNGVTIHKDLGDNNASIENCIILGSLNVQGGGVNSITLNNSRIAACNVSKSDSAVRVVAKGETFILNTDVSYAAKLETSSLSGTDYGIGFYRVNTNSSTDLTLAGSFPRLNVNGSSPKVKLESGTITVLDVSSSSRSPEITLENYGTVTTANVNGPAAFHGNGDIRTMHANANNITYEKKPSTLNIGSNVSTKPSETDPALSTTFDPVNGAKSISINKQITITFSQAIKKYNGNALSSSDLKDIIYLKKDSKSGTAVAFTASINSTKKVITIVPDKSLTTDTKYYVGFDRNVFKDENNEGNDEEYVYFTVGTGTVDGVTFAPLNGATAASTSVEPTITFEEAIETYSGDEITSKYLKSNIVFKTKSSSGSDVSFTASINSKAKTITISPSSKLTAGQKYYLGFSNKVFRTKSGDKAITGQNVLWTAATTVPTATFSPVTGSVNIASSSAVTITFSERMYNTSTVIPTAANVTGAVTFRDNTAAANISYTATFADSTSNPKIVITPAAPLVAGHNYTVTLAASQFKNAEGGYVASTATTFTVASSIDVTVINTAISRATTAKTGVSSSADGSDIYTTNYWVTAAQMTALDTAITTATNAKSTVQTAAAATTIASTLDTATTTFEAAKKLGLKVRIDVSVIDSAISTANSAKSGIYTSFDGTDVDANKRWVTTAQLSVLNQAISTAESAKATVQTIEAANSAASALNSAVSTFEGQRAFGTKVIVDKSSLSSAINSAKIAKSGILVNSDSANVDSGVTFVSDSVMNAFTTQIGNAEAVLLNDNATKSEVDSAVSTINDAISAFNGAKQTGTKVSPIAPIAPVPPADPVI